MGKTTEKNYEKKARGSGNEALQVTFLDQLSNQLASIDSLVKSFEITKKDKSLYEKMDNEIVLDTNLLQSLATDLIKGSQSVNKYILGTKANKYILGEDLTKKLIEIEQNDHLNSNDKNFDDEEKSLHVSLVANKIVEALTSAQVLGKVLTTDEASILNDYFSRKLQLNEKVLATLDTALDKILCRAHEFYDDKKELASFLKDRDSAKIKLLDAMIAKKSSFLMDLMSEANYYADKVSKGLIDAYKLATDGILVSVARENLQYMQAAVGHTYRYSKDLACRGAAFTFEAAVRGREIAAIGATVGAQITYNAASSGQQLMQQGTVAANKMATGATELTFGAASNGKKLAQLGMEVGAKMAQNAARFTYDVANKSSQLVEIGKAVRTKMTENVAKITCDMANRSKQYPRMGLAVGTKITQDAAIRGI
ncbi:unnamed protein product [Thelazia callipaeda]|uniref:Senescence domain-containing protein n=1 Tax=Thelazia callipaeda TaxID=103827 RepID=A0A0N5CQD8_THECL|nr:unnamed protein product [Thelazia callipaeda]